ncbi:MAG: MFS transporter [Paracoccaceae bacterium]
MRLIISFAALFLSVIFLQLTSGSLGPLDALSGLQEGFTKTQVGLLGSAHFAGFFVGCWVAPRLMGSAGHLRAFAAFAAIGAIGAVAHPIWVDALGWSLLRVMTGLSISGCYTVVEAWLQAKVTNDTRGRVLGVYRVVDMGASLVAQLMIGFLEPASYVSYNIITILCIASLLPLMLTTARAPVATGSPRLRPLEAMRLSPLAAAGVVAAGVSSPAFRMVGPVYGQDVGLRADQIGFFLAAGVLGGALAQFPVGWLADKLDRRKVLIGLSMAAAAVCAGTVFLTGAPQSAIFAASFLFGATTFPIFSVSAAHANDFASAEGVVELNASLLFIYGIGAIASPLVASILVENLGPAALFGFVGVVHAGLAALGAARMLVRPTSPERTPYAYVPRTSFLLGRLLRRRNGSATHKGRDAAH